MPQDVIQDYKALSPFVKPDIATIDEALDEELDEALDEKLDEALISIDTTINEALDEELGELFKSSSGGLRREDFSLLFQTAPCYCSLCEGWCIHCEDGLPNSLSAASRKRSVAAIQTPALPSRKRLAAAIWILAKCAGWTVEQMRSYIDPNSW